MSMQIQALREVVSLNTELKLIQAEAKIKSQTVDQAIILADDPAIKAIASKAMAYKLNGTTPEVIVSLLAAEAMQNMLKDIAQEVMV